MKLSIWQQFSSNHSGGFWYVGTFDTVEAAENARLELRSVLFEIDRWHQEHPQESAVWQEQGRVEPIPAEQAIAERYGVEWYNSIDWNGWGSDDEEDWIKFLTDSAITIVGRNVIVSNPEPVETWTIGVPFEAILARLGATTMGYETGMIDGGVMAEKDDVDFSQRLTFTAPDQVTADRIEADIRRYLSGRLVSRTNPPPWNDDEANFRVALPSSRLLKESHVEALRQRWQKEYENAAGREEAHGPIERLAFRGDQTTLQREGLNFTLAKFTFYKDALGASALIAWLEANGCTVTDYTFVPDVLVNLTCVASDEETAAAIHAHYLAFRRKIRCEGRHLAFVDWVYSEDDLPDLLADLAQRGCIDVAYQTGEWQTLWRAVSPLPAPDDNVVLLIDVLEHATDQVDRVRAARELGKLKAAAAFDALIGALDDTDYHVREAAASALDKLADRRAFHLLLDALKREQEWYPKSSMISALGKFRDPSTIPLLIELLSEKQVWEYAVRALVKLGELAVKPLQDTRDHVDAEMQQRIDRALLEIDRETGKQAGL